MIRREWLIYHAMWSRFTRGNLSSAFNMAASWLMKASFRNSRKWMRTDECSSLSSHAVPMVHGSVHFSWIEKEREREINEFKPKNIIKNETLPSPALRWCSQLPKIIAVKIAADNWSQMWNLWNVLKCITGSNEHNSCITVTDKSEICLSGGTTARRCWWRIYKVSAAVSLSVCWPMHWFERQQKLMEIKKGNKRKKPNNK